MSPDITMCSGHGCPMADECYRHTAKQSALQVFFVTPPFVNDLCEYFIQDWKVVPVEPEPPNVNSTVDKKERRNELRCAYCPPNKKENAKRKAKPDKYKSRRKK